MSAHRPERLILLAVMLTALSAQPAVTQAQAGATRTVWDAVYTEAQAARGTATFGQSCANCHTLSTDGNRPVVGDKFWEGFAQKSVADLLKYVSTNMPNGNNAGSLPASTYLDLVALILKSNGFPSGATELSADTAVGVSIVQKDGPGELPANTLVRVVGCLAPKSGSDWVLTNMTPPTRVERPGAAAEDAQRPLGTRTITLKFVLTRLDAFVGKRLSVSGILIGAGGADGLNVTSVNRVAEACP